MPRTQAAPRSPEDAIRRIARSGDAQALGELFDLTAKDLFRAAVAMTGDAATAEDALQDTYVAVLGAAGRFAPEERAMPWLVGILRHKVQHAKRRARRAAGGAGVPERGSRAEGTGPALPRVEVARVRGEMEGLAEPYRSVALLRWRYGLSPAEIAHVRGQAPGTVWSLLSRALARLRKRLGGLPAVVFGWRDARGLPAVREAVVSCSTGGAATSAAVAAGGVVMATKATVVAVGVAAALLGAGGATLVRPVAPASVAPSEVPVPAERAHAGLAGDSSEVADLVAAPRAPTSPERPAGGGVPASAPYPAAGPAASPSSEEGATRVAQAEITLGRMLGSSPAGGDAVAKDGTVSPNLPAIVEKLRALEERTRAATGEPSHRMRSVAELADRLQLDPRARADVEEAVATAVQDLLVLRRTPNARGRTWEQAQADTLKMVNAARVLDDSEILSWRKQAIPGRGEGETYGLVERRLLEGARARMRDAVAPAQREAFDALDVTLLFGPLPSPGHDQPSLSPAAKPPPK